MSIFQELHFFFIDPATAQIYTLSLHDALPISSRESAVPKPEPCPFRRRHLPRMRSTHPASRSEEHTSELQSRRDLVCRLLLEKKYQNHEIGERATVDLADVRAGLAAERFGRIR